VSGDDTNSVDESKEPPFDSSGAADEISVGLLYEINGTEACTHPLYLFLNDYFNILDAFFYFVNLATRADEMRVRAHKALSGISEHLDDGAKYREPIDENSAFKRLQKYSNYTSRNLTNSIVDSYLCYVTAVVQKALHKRPEAIKSGEAIRIEEILDFTNRRDLVKFLIERKINSLSYGGLGGIERYVQSTLGCNLFDSEKTKFDVLLFIEIRNINSHNRGIINQIFLERTKILKTKEKFELGKRAHVDFTRLSQGNRIWNSVNPDGERSVNEAASLVVLRSEFAGIFHERDSAVPNAIALSPLKALERLHRFCTPFRPSNFRKV